jgi:hypothetical protein
VRGCQAEQSIDIQQYGGDVKMSVEAERRSDLKEESSDLNQLEVAAKDTRECVRERGTNWTFTIN